MSCPSHSATSQPKARHFSAKGASDISRAMGPVC